MYNNEQPQQQVIHNVKVEQGFWRGFRVAAGIAMLLVGLWILFTYVLFPDKEIICPIPEPVAVITAPEPATKTGDQKVTTTQPEPKNTYVYVTQTNPQSQPTPIVTVQPTTNTQPTQNTNSNNNGTSAERRLCEELADMNDDTVSSTMTNYGSCIASYKNGLTNAVNSSLASPEQKDMLARLIALGY